MVRVRASGERGSQAVELALVIPAVLLLIALVAQAGVVASDLVAAQGIAREAARAAAVGGAGDVAAAASARRAAGLRDVEVSFAPPSGARGAGDLVTATLRLRSLAVFGAPVWLPARATMRVEAAAP